MMICNGKVNSKALAIVFLAVVGVLSPADTFPLAAENLCKPNQYYNPNLDTCDDCTPLCVPDRTDDCLHKCPSFIPPEQQNKDSNPCGWVWLLLWICLGVLITTTVVLVVVLYRYTQGNTTVLCYNLPKHPQDRHPVQEQNLIPTQDNAETRDCSRVYNVCVC